MRKSNRQITILLLFFIVLCKYDISSGSEIDLGYKFRVGEVNKYKLLGKIKQTITVPEENPVHSSQEIEMHFSETIMDVNYDTLISDTVAGVRTDFNKVIFKGVSGDHNFFYD